MLFPRFVSFHASVRFVNLLIHILRAQSLIRLGQGYQDNCHNSSCIFEVPV